LLSRLLSFTCYRPVHQAQTNQRKQKRKNIDSLFIVYSLPVSVGLSKNYFNNELKDSIAAIIIRKGYDYPDSFRIVTLFKEKIFAFLPSPVTEKERFKEVMEKAAKDQNYIWSLAEQAEPFLQRIILSAMQNDAGEYMIIVNRQNLPNGRKDREWTFKFDEKEPVQILAARIVATLANKK